MIEVTNLTSSKIDTKSLFKTADVASAVLGMRKDISLVFVSDAKMKELNKKYRRKNKITDVLSFEELNEIFICLPQAEKQAKALKVSINCELTRLLTHGIVHLKGYDHEKSTEEAERMFAVEEKILNKIS